MTTIISITEDEFDATYSLLRNHLNSHAAWVIGEGPGCLFETYGEELDFVRHQDPRTVWTFLDGDDGNLLVVSGFQYVNAIGYLLSTTPVDDGVTVQVIIETDAEDASRKAQ